MVGAGPCPPVATPLFITWHISDTITCQTIYRLKHNQGVQHNSYSKFFCTHLVSLCYVVYGINSNYFYDASLIQPIAEHLIV